jgi:hypothetical protein
MAKVIVEMEFDCEEFDEASDKGQFLAIETVLEAGAEATNSFINIKSISIKREE